MFEFAQYLMRNPTTVTTNVRKQWEVRKAMKKFRKEHKYCFWCGRSKKVGVHHVVPVSVRPDLAADCDNMLTLCRKPACHLIVGHSGNYGTRYVQNVRKLCKENMTTKTKGWKDE